MNTNDFLDSLEEKGFVKPQVLAQLRAKVEGSSKAVTARSIAKYLIDKGLLSKFQARQLLSDTEKPADIAEEIEVSERESHDTNELMRDIAPAGLTRMDADEEIQADAEDDSVEVVEVEHEATGPQPIDPIALPEHDAMGDPLGMHFGQVDETPESPLTPGFAGKRSKTNQWESKWLFVGGSILGFLIIAGIILGYTLLKTDSEKMWEAAVEDFNNARYTSAIEKLTDYVNAYPSHDRTSEAKVKIANCKLRIPFDSKQWDKTLTRAKTVLPNLQSELNRTEDSEKFDMIRDELAVILPGTALGISRKALDADDVNAKQELLNSALDARQQVDISAYVPGSQKRKPGVNNVIIEVDDNIAIVKRQIQMENDYTVALETIRQQTERGETNEAFITHNALTRKYQELEIRNELRELMRTVSTREADLVHAVNLTIHDAQPAASPIQSTVVVATKTVPNSIAGLADEMLVYLVNGAIYGIRAVDGQVIWRKYVGVETDSHPFWLNNDRREEIIAVNSRDNQLMRIRAIDGEVIWQVEIGEPFAEPYLGDGVIVVSTSSGKVMLLDQESGKTSQAAQLPQATQTSGVTIGRLPYVYQLGSHSNLYVLAADTMQCKEVVYLGHKSNTISIPPLVISGYLIIAENGTDYCKLRIFHPTDAGLGLVEIRPEIRLDGQVTAPMTHYGRWGLVRSDKGDLKMLEVNKAAEEQPVTVVVAANDPGRGTVRHYLFATEGQMWSAGSGIRRYKIRKAQGEFDRQKTANNLDRFIGSPLKINENLFHVRQRESSALTSVSAVNATTLEEIWRTDFAGPLAGPPLAHDDRMIVVSSQGDVFHIDQDTLSRGVTDKAVSLGSTVVQTLVFDRVLQLDANRFVATAPPSRGSIMSVDTSRNPPNKLSQLESAANKPSCRPVAFGNAILVPTLRGQVFRINPFSGRAIGAPFQPPLKPNVDTIWRQPAIVGDGSQFIIGDANGRFYLVRAVAEQSLQKADEFQFDGELLSDLQRVGQSVIAICRDESGDKVIAISDGNRIIFDHRASLPGGYVAGPMPIGDGRFLVMVDSGETVCFNEQLELQWASRIPSSENGQSANQKIVGLPQVFVDKVGIPFQSGLLVTIDPVTGEIIESINLGQPISQAPVEIGGQLFVSGADGTLHHLGAAN